MNDLLFDLRQQIDDFMEHHPQSPLDREQRRAFKGLSYYEPEPAWAVTAVVDRFPSTEPLIEMETSTGDLRHYRRWGRATFTAANGQEAALTIYADPHEGDFFLPFKDDTNGQETYRAGRYLDSYRPGLAQLSETEVEIDFNFAYNPYCAYSPTYSCPLPPRENWLTVTIRAGEKIY